MSKWRPLNQDCIYVIGDVHGQLAQLQVIFSRILPLRKSDGINDRLVMLGDYVDRGVESHKVLDLLIEKKNKFKDKISLLRGNHESMFLEAIKNGESNPSNYDLWMVNGGESTLLGYLQRKDLPIDNLWSLSRSRLKDLVPEEHIDFLENKLDNFIETDEHIFVHAGCDPFNDLKYQEKNILLYDRSLFKFVKRMSVSKSKLPWKKTIIAGHNTDSSLPFIYDKYIMLDCSSKLNICVMEINSMEAFIAKFGNGRLVKLDQSYL